MYLLASLHNNNYEDTINKTLKERVNEIKIPIIGIPISSEIQMVRTLPLISLINEKYEDVILLKMEKTDNIKKVGVLDVADMVENMSKEQKFNILTETYEDIDYTIKEFEKLEESNGLEEDLCVYIVPVEIAKQRVIAALNIFDILEYIDSGTKQETINKIKKETDVEKSKKIIENEKLIENFNPLFDLNETINNISKCIECFDNINIKKILNGKTPVSIHIDKMKSIWQQLNEQIKQSILATSEEEFAIEINVKIFIIIKLTIVTAMGPLLFALLENTKLKADSAFMIIDIGKQRNLFDNMKVAKKYEIIKAIQDDLSDSAITNIKQRKEIRRFNKK